MLKFIPRRVERSQPRRSSLNRLIGVLLTHTHSQYGHYITFFGSCQVVFHSNLLPSYTYSASPLDASHDK